MENNFLEVPAERYEQISASIQSKESVVGIDARHTHIVIIHKLIEIEKRLAALEAANKAN